MVILEINNLSKKYKNKLVLDSISLSVKKGEIVAFVGNNGVGKTTTIKCILNEINFNGGTITYKGEKIKNFSQLKEIAFFPDLSNIPLNLKTKEYIEYIATINTISKKIYEERINNLESVLNLRELMHKKIKNLSSGEKKRLIFAGVLIKSPDLIILDEPTSNLDVQGRADFLNILLKLNKIGVTIIITSHVLDELQNFANRLVIINDTKIVYNNTFDSTKENMGLLFQKYAPKNLENVDSLSMLFDK